MRRSIVLAVGLLIPLVLVVLLLSTVLSLAATSVDESSGAAASNSVGVELPAATDPYLSSLAPYGAEFDSSDVGILWGRESMSRDEEDEEFPAWLTNLPPRPRAEIPLPPVREQAFAGQPSFPRFQRAEQVPYRAPQPSTPEAYPVPVKVTQAEPAAAYLWTGEPGWPSPTTTEAPLAPQLPYTVTLGTIHRAIDGAGFSSTFVVTNSTGVAADYYLGFFWPNDINHHTEGPYTLPDGESHFYDMAVVDFGVGTYAGYVEISSDHLLEGRILTPDYGLISGIVHESDGLTPLQIDGVSVHRFSDDLWYGGVYNLADGRFYVGGLPDDDYVLHASAPYPWASQWYDSRVRRDQADPITISGAGETPIVVTMQPGGRISGTVHASDGITPLENVNVDVEQGGYGVCTNADGEFEIRGLLYGDYKVVAGQGWNWCLDAESIWITEYYDESPDSEGAATLSLYEGNDTFQNINFTLDEGGTIEGTVLADDGTTPLENVNVDIEQGGYGACTDASGHYTISGLPYDDYKVRAGGGWNGCLDEESPYVTEYYEEQSNPDSADIVSVGGGTPNVTGIDFTLSEGGSITGCVTDESSGVGLADVWVWADYYDDWSWGQGAWTGADGCYTISGLPDQDYRVAIQDQGLPEGYARQFFPDQFAWDRAERVTVVDGGTVPNIDFHLAPGGTITGVVLDAGTGEPISNINLYMWSPSVGGGMGACTDASGHYTFTGAIYSGFVVQASDTWNHCQDLPPEYARTYYDGVYTYSEATLVPVDETAPDVTGIDFDMVPAGTITGWVTDDLGNPLENINVSANMPSIGAGEGTCSGPDGYYEIYGLLYGDHVVQAGSDWNWCLDEYSTYLVEYWEEVHTYEEATPVLVSETPQTGIDFTLSEAGSIIGRVTADSDGSPLADVWVSVSPYDGGWGGRGAHTDADGYYTVTALFDGDYRVSIEGDSVPFGYAQQYYPDQFAHHLAEPVNIFEGGTAPGIDFHLVPGGIITGAIFDQDTSQPVANIQVDAWPMDGEGGMGACTNADGSYTIRGAIYGGYAVASGGDWNGCQDQPNEYIRKYWDNVYTWNEATRIDVENPNPVTNINLAMERGGYISGNVSDTGGSPVEGLQVAAVLPGDCPWCHEWVTSTETDASGDYLLGPLPPYGVAVYACASCDNHLYVDEWYDDVWNIEAATLITITTGTTESGIDIIVDPGVLVTGTVTVPGGYSAEGIQVDVWEETENGYGTGGQTDASGFYQVPVPPIYDSNWSVSIQPYGTDLGAQWAHGFDLSRQTTWDFDLGPGATIAGTVTSDGVPVEGAWINADSPWMSNGAETDADGNYEITNLPPGEYQVRSERWPDYKEAFYGGHNWDSGTRIWLEEGEYQGGIDVDIQPLGRLYGTVYESDGATPIEGVRVIAMNDDGYWDAWTESDGRFYLDVPAGDLRVRFITDPWWSRVTIYYGDAYSYATAAVVSVPPYYPDELPEEISINLEQPATLDGTVVDADTGDPVGGVMVSVEVRDPGVDQHIFRMSNCTDETGQYHIDFLWPGENKVWASGICSGSDYGMVTDTLTAVAGDSHVLDIEVTAGSAPERPFTIHTTNSNDYTPLLSYGLTGLSYADEILPALFTPLVDLNDQNEWVSELLVQVPTIDNGGAVIVGDQLEVTYELLPDLLWSDGAPLTSDDIRFTWELMTKPGPDGDQYLAYINPLWHIESVDTSGPLTAVVTYRPEYFPPGFEGTIGYLMPEHVLAGKNRLDIRYVSDYAHYPVGNGPYIVVDYVPGSHIDLAPNPKYHRRDELLPNIEEVRFLFANDINSALPNGAADVALNVNPDVYAGLDIPTQTRIRSSYASVVPNTDLPFFEDVQVRRALYYAMDRDQYIDGYGTYAAKADAYLPPGHPMFTDTLNRYSYDLDEAEILLDAAGWVDTNTNGIRDKDGVEFEFDLVYNIGNDARQGLCLIWQEDLATIGVDMNCVSMEWSELIQAGRRSQLDAYTMGWYFDSRYDPMGYYLFHSRYVASAYNSYWGGNPNNRWTDPIPSLTDAWLEAARTELDPDLMRGYYADHLERFTDQLPSWVYNHSTRTDAYIPILHNFGPGQATAATWNIAEWVLESNPYDVAVRMRLAEDSPAPQPGADIIYEILVHNYGTQPVTNVRLLVWLRIVQFVSATPTEDSYEAGTLTWNLGTIPAKTSAAPVRVTAHIPAEAAPPGTLVITNGEVYGDEADTYPSNNGFLYNLIVRDDVDLAVSKAGVGQAAIGGQYTYLIDYANWGGAPAEGVVVTDTLPAEVTFQFAEPAPTDVDGLVLTWDLGTLEGNQWGGQIEVTTLIAEAGTITNIADISLHPDDIDLGNNFDQAIEDIDEILAPIITQPTQGTTGGDPLFRGLAAPGATVELWDLSDSGAGPIFLGTTDADPVDGTWELPLPLDEGTYAIAATATADSLTSGYSNEATIIVDHVLPLDTNSVSISTSGVDIARGVVRANRYTLGYRTLVLRAEIPCAETPEPSLRVIENGLWNYILPPVSMTEVETGLWEVTFHLWMSDPHSTYDIWLDWECGLESQSVRLLSVVIDPDGYVYDDSMVQAGEQITDSLILDAMVTAYVWRPDLEEWEEWLAGSYGQSNPQWTDGTTPDGVLEEGYYSFLTPPGQYRIIVEAPGYQPYQSPVLTVISDPIHHDIPLQPVVGGSGNVVEPANLSGSTKQVDTESATKGDTLTYDIWLANSGEWDTGSLVLTDAIPDNTAYVSGSLNWTGGGSAEYNSGADAVTWSGVVPADSQVHISFQVTITSDEGAPFYIWNVAEVEGPAENLTSLPDLTAATEVAEPREYTIYLPLVLKNH